MPSKSRRRKGKPATQSGKKRVEANRPSPPVPPPAVTQADESVSSPKLPVPEVAVPTIKAEPVTVSYPFITAELRSIGVLAAIMLVVLAVLTLLFA